MLKEVTEQEAGKGSDPAHDHDHGHSSHEQGHEHAHEHSATCGHQAAPPTPHAAEGKSVLSCIPDSVGSVMCCLAPNVNTETVGQHAHSHEHVEGTSHDHSHSHK